VEPWKRRKRRIENFRGKILKKKKNLKFFSSFSTLPKKRYSEVVSEPCVKSFFSYRFPESIFWCWSSSNSTLKNVAYLRIDVSYEKNIFLGQSKTCSSRETQITRFSSGRNGDLSFSWAIGFGLTWIFFFPVAYICPVRN
jgi:hypothetical protein